MLTLGCALAIMVNGLRLGQPKRLRSGDRVILGDFHIFRFNHPQEARDERKEQSLLRHAITTSQLGSPMPRPGHSRTVSRGKPCCASQSLRFLLGPYGPQIDPKAILQSLTDAAESDTEGDTSRSNSPFPQRRGRDSDWSLARREAASAILGADQKITHLTDDELDSLFDDVQRVRAVRKGRPESRLFGPDDEDFESISSYPYRDKYMSNGTIDNFSLDTALTIPSSPPQEGIDDEGTNERYGVLEQAEEDRGDSQQSPRSVAESSNQETEDLKRQHQIMQEALKAAKEDFERQIQQQKDDFNTQLKQISNSPSPRITQDGFTELSDAEKAAARYWSSRWRQTRHLHLVELILQRAALLKEVQIMSQSMDKSVVFQFAILEEGQSICSSYDLVLSGISGDEDEALETMLKPCIAIRLIDYRHSVIRLWSLEKLENRLHAMRQIHQYLAKPEMVRHFQLENPFIEACMPQFSLIGEVSVPLTAVFKAHVQDYKLNVLSTFTQSIIGVIRLSLEPSSAEVPSTMLKFNVVMHDLVGFPEHEGTNVHAQLFIPGISEEGGATTTQMISDFDEDRIHFESVHSMSLPFDAPRTASLRVSLFARVTSMHMDKLVSWDEMREASEAELDRKKTWIKPRLPDSEYYVEEQHDVFVKFKILELSDSGEYLPVEAEQVSNLDPGTYQLRQGLQRRIVLNLSYSSTESLQWTGIKSLRIGNIRLLDPGATVPHVSSPKEGVLLNLVGEPRLEENGSGIKELTVTGQWDSSLHGSILLDRPTSENYIVKIYVAAELMSLRTQNTMTFTLDQNIQIRPRSWLRPQSLFKQLWKTTRIVHITSGIFAVILKPKSLKRAADIWRVDSKREYVKGEEMLSNWQPRGVSLVHDIVKSKQRQQRIADVEATKLLLGRSNWSYPTSLCEGEMTDTQQHILERSLKFWRTPSETVPLLSSPDESSVKPATASPSPPTRPELVARIRYVDKNPLVLMSSYVLSPTPISQKRWARHFAELRPPYLHVYNVPSGEQAFIINLRHARIDTDPPLQHLLCGDGGGAAGWGKNVWAVYGAMNTWLFAARSEKEKGEWVLAIDEAFLGE